MWPTLEAYCHVWAVEAPVMLVVATVVPMIVPERLELLTLARPFAVR